MKKYTKFLKRIGVRIEGTPKFIHFDVVFDSTDQYSLIKLCDNCTISSATHLLTHDYSIWHAAVGCNLSKKSDAEFKIKGSIEIGENAFVGMRCIILPNVRIGKNSIVGAGSVVTKDVPEGVIVAGNPARPISSIEEYVRKNPQCKSG